MVAYNFQGRFAADVEAGRKNQTLRPVGLRAHARPGDVLQLYTGMRTKACRNLGDAICTHAIPVMIHANQDAEPKVSMALETGLLDMNARDRFARSDGFGSFQDFEDWWLRTHGVGTFSCVLIKLRGLEPSS